MAKGQTIAHRTAENPLRAISPKTARNVPTQSAESAI